MTDRPGTDTTMDGRTAIAPGPDGPAPVQMSQADIDARVNREVDARLEVVNTENAERLSQATAEGARSSALSTLQAMIDGNPGDTLEAVQFRSKVQDMVLAIHNGSDKPPAEHVAEAMRLNEARIQQIAATGGDGAQNLPALAGSGDVVDDRFSMGRFLVTLAGQAKELGERFDPEKMTGAPEMEYASELLTKSKWAADKFAALSADADGRSRVIPFPMAALRPEAVFAETYGSDVATRREPTYRRDALVPFPRPAQALAGLGVPMPMIDNDLTLPRLTASMAGGWYAETGSISDESLTVGTIATSPKRFGSRDDLSWMLLAGGDAQFGHVPLIIAEMSKAQMQRKERQVYDKQGTAVTNAPTGILRATGVTITALAADTVPTFTNILAMITDVAGDDVPMESPGFVLGVKARQDLSGVRRFTTGDASLFNDIAYRSGGDVPGIGSFQGNVGMMPGGMAFVTTQIPVYAAADAPIRASDTYIIFGGDWSYVWCIDYGVAFLTIDDISLAVSGQTRITLNSFHDVAVRWPQAFSAIRYDAG